MHMECYGWTISRKETLNTWIDIALGILSDIHISGNLISVEEITLKTIIIIESAHKIEQEHSPFKTMDEIITNHRLRIKLDRCRRVDRMPKNGTFSNLLPHLHSRHLLPQPPHNLFQEQQDLHGLLRTLLPPCLHQHTSGQMPSWHT